MAKLLQFGAGKRSQIIVAVAVVLWLASAGGLVSGEQLTSGIQILGILFGGTFAAKIQRLVGAMGSET